MTLPAKSPGPAVASHYSDHKAHASGAAAPVISLRDLKAHCMSCSMRDLCVPLGLDEEGMQKVDALINTRTKLKKGEPIYRAGDTFHSLYAIRLGSLKTTVLAEDGREQVAGYHILGDIVGMDGIGTHRHGCQAIALEDTEVCLRPFVRLEDLSRAVPQLQHNLHLFLARIARPDHALLASMRAERLDVPARPRRTLSRRGYSSTQFVLRMTREEIGSYLGLKLETVSRLFSRFHDEGMIQVQGRAVKLLDTAALKQLIGRHY
jgi:CRP/FNR family transcriptional regulator